VVLTVQVTEFLHDTLRDKGAPYDIAATEGGYMWEMYWINEDKQVVEVVHIANESRFPEYEICVSLYKEKAFELIE
jgi:hypothetical protein